MELPPIWILELGIAALLAAGFLCAQAEYALFLYGLALGFPDLALPLGTAINLRLDDLLIVLFLMRSLFWIPARSSESQKKILAAEAVFYVFCIGSAAIETSFRNPPPAYEFAKMIGCLAILFALPRVVQSRRRMKFLVAGLMCGGIALVIQIAGRLGSSAGNVEANFQEYKNAATFTTWNPNTLGQAAMLLVFSSALGGILFARSRLGRLVWIGLAAGFALIPASMFVRGTTLSLALSFLLFLGLARRWKWILAFAALSLCAGLALRARNPRLFEGATQVDVRTGEGFSHRFDRWQAAIEAIRERPVSGRGFGQEWVYLSSMGSEGRAHNAYLTVWLELGIGGLALLLAVIYQQARVGLSLYGNSQFRYLGALLLALTAVQCFDSFGLPTLYCEKLPTIAVSIAIALAGICERSAAESAPERSRPLPLDGIPQHSEV